MQQWKIHCRLKRSLNMYRYLSTSQRLLKPSFFSLSNVLQRSFSSEANLETVTNGKKYDLSTYKFEYTDDEREIILGVLNQSSEEDLKKVKITKGIARKLIECRKRLGTFETLFQLLDVKGFGIKSAERVCNKVLKEKLCGDIAEQSLSEETTVITPEKKKSIVQKRRFVKPRIPALLKDNFETILALDVTVGCLAWTLLNHDGMVLGIGTFELLSKEERLDSPKLYDKIVLIYEALPKADMYVWEEKVHISYLQRASMASIFLALKLAQIKGILTALLVEGGVNNQHKHLFYLRDILVSRLFDLQVGSERISGLSLADNLMQNQQVFEWLPPLEVNNDAKQLYFSIDKTQRKFVSTSLFVGIAFYQVILQNNTAALEF